MKSLFIISLFSLSAYIMLKGPAITFTTNELNVDTISAPVYRGEFTFVNSGDEPLIIHRAAAAAGNVTTRWDREPIEPGGKGKIEFLMDTRHRQGPFHSTITVDVNITDQEKHILVIKGYIKGNED